MFTGQIGLVEITERAGYYTPLFGSRVAAVVEIEGVGVSVRCIDRVGVKGDEGCNTRGGVSGVEERVDCKRNNGRGWDQWVGNTTGATAASAKEKESENKENEGTTDSSDNGNVERTGGGRGGGRGRAAE